MWKLKLRKLSNIKNLLKPGIFTLSFKNKFNIKMYWIFFIALIFSFSAFSEFVLCKYTHVNQDCGHDAVVFLQKHLDRIANPLLHEHCAHYTYGDGTCSSSARATEYNNAFYILMVIFYWLIIVNSANVLWGFVKDFWIFKINFR